MVAGGWTMSLSFGVVVVASAMAPGQGDVETGYDQQDRAQTLRRDVSYYEPPAYTPAVGGTRVTLEVCEATNTFNNIRLRHRSYNGDLVGPVIRVRPGMALDIRLENLLAPESGDSHSANSVGGFNTTNLHTHGLHVSPQAPADNVFVEIGPGEHYQYHFELPPDHPAGTFWYHAHKHGSTALQLASGMAGALIVEGGLDEVSKIRAAKEQILVIQQFVYREIPGEDAIVHPDDVYDELEPRRTAINGQVTPTIVMQPGEVQRWRLIHAGVGDPMVLKLAGIKLHEIAIDGLAIGARVERDEVELQPGYRSDVLIQAPAAENAYVLTARMLNPRRSARRRVFEATDILKLVVIGLPKPMELPDSDDLKPYAAFTDADVPRDTDVAAKREVHLEQTDLYRINGKEFDPTYVEFRPQLNSAEEWKVFGSPAGHPFHVHVNPFAVRVPPGDPNPNKWVWRDTLYVEQGKPVELRSWFHDFSGKTVMHCHMLDHEDKGMMQAFEIVDPAIAAEVAAADPDVSRGLAPPWEAIDADTGQAARSNEWDRATALVVFHRGVSCIHCAEQLGRLAERLSSFDKLGVEVVTVCPFLPDPAQLAEIRDQTGIRYRMLVDSDLASFRKFDCLGADGVPLHGLFLISPNRQILWRSIGETAEADIDRILAQCRRALNDAAVQRE